MSMPKPFAVIATNYIDLEGNIKTNPNGTYQRGLFLVLHITQDGCALCCKITSQITNYLNEFTVPLARLNNTYLYTDSFVQCDKIQTIKLNTHTEILGSLENSDRFKVYANIQKYLNGVSDDIFKFLIPFKRPLTYTSPNVQRNYLPSSPCGLSEDKKGFD